VKAYVPLHRKDLPVLPAVLQGLRANTGVKDVVVMAAKSLWPRVRRLGVSFVDEDQVVDGVRHDSVSHPRWGWYFQQIIKLGVAWMETEDYYLCLDADMVFLNPVEFFAPDGAPLLTEAWEMNPAYFDTFHRLLGFEADRQCSFIAHHMVFDGRRVREMCMAFRPHTPWWANIVDCVQPRPPWNSGSQFSEFETYGHYLKAVHPEEARTRRLRWRNVDVLPSRRVIRRLQKDYDMCGFQAYLREERRLSRPWRVWLARVKRAALRLAGRAGGRP